MSLKRVLKRWEGRISLKACIARDPWIGPLVLSGVDIHGKCWQKKRPLVGIRQRWRWQLHAGVVPAARPENKGVLVGIGREGEWLACLVLDLDLVLVRVLDVDTVGDVLFLLGPTVVSSMTGELRWDILGLILIRLITRWEGCGW